MYVYDLIMRSCALMRQKSEHVVEIKIFQRIYRVYEGQSGSPSMILNWSQGSMRFLIAQKSQTYPFLLLEVRQDVSLEKSI